MTVLMIICAVLVITGLAFMLASLIGIAVLPDFFTRLHAQGVGDTIGAFFVLAGMAAAAWGGLLPVKIFLIFLVIVLTNPIGTNLMMIAAINKEDYLGYRTGIVENTPQEAQTEADIVEEAQSGAASEGNDAVVSFNEEAPDQKADGRPESDNHTDASDSQKKRKPRKRKPSMSMNKAELIKAAENRGIIVPEEATKREILDLIYGGSTTDRKKNNKSRQAK